MILFSNYCKLIFLPILFFNMILMISSNSWFILWICFEINLMSFIPLLNNNIKFSSELYFNYFISQSFGSIIFFLSSMMFSFNFLFLNIKMFWQILISFSMILKLGMFPFHFWYIKISKYISWINFLILSTWMKIYPLLITMHFPQTFLIWFSSILISMILSIMSLNQISLRLIMCFSSINHLCWITMNIILNKFSWLTYFLFYSIIMFSSIFSFYLFNLNSLNEMYKIMYSFKIMKSMIFLNFFSLSGLPPFIGFYPKLISIKMFMLNFHPFMSISMMMYTLISIFFYLQIIFPNLFSMSKEMKLNYFKIKIFKFNYLILFSMFLFLSLTQLMSFF